MREFPVVARSALCLLAVLVPLAAARAGQTVDVLYAGSLVNLLERGVGPAFDRASGDRFRGYAGGSKQLASEIKAKLRHADIFISAAPKVNRALMGEANGNWVRWYVTFAQSLLVIGYNPKSRFATAFGKEPWYEALLQRDIRLGRTDPKLDPKGALTLALMKKAEAFYKMPGLSRRILGAADNPRQIFPEETLVGRLQSGQLDAGFFYASETADDRIPAARLPAAVAPKARYTITILRGAPHGQAAEAFLAYLLGPQGRAFLKQHGLDPVAPAIVGDPAAAPKGVKALAAKNG
ncbi:MAG TPA: extracellular solute-binding protein [Stellaceae bacterium]|nr:extracellular solute-binding protein [Stellaceae bacterium]